MDENKQKKVRSANISTTKVTDSNGQTASTRDTTLRSEVTVKMKKVMILAVIGSMLLSTLISVIAGINVYYVIIAKVVDDQHRTSTTSSQYQTDALFMTVKELKNNLTAASDEWNEEMLSLKANVSELDRNLTAASDEWNEEMKSLQANVSELDRNRNQTAASDQWNEEMKSLQANVLEIERNLTTASDIWNEEMKSLKTNFSELDRNLTAATDEWNEEMLSLKANVSELDRNLTAASDEWNEEMKLLQANVSELDRNLTAASGEWNEEMISLKTNVSELDRNLTAASDEWNEEMLSLKANVSELDRYLTAASDVWNGEILSMKANVSELARNLTPASDAWNESIACNYSKDCSELYAAGTVVDGVYTISPDGRCPFHVYCDMTGGGWTLIQKRIDGLVRFNRSWQEYEEGFGNIDGEHWLGLDNIHRLTANGSEIYIHFEDYNGTVGFAHYQTFFVHGANTTYRMNVEYKGYKGTISKKKFRHSDNMMFTTYDRDNDRNSRGNCANKYWFSGGWWFNHCYQLGNLNGVYGRLGRGGIAYRGGGGDVYLKYVNMKVKPSPGHY